MKNTKLLLGVLLLITFLAFLPSLGNKLTNWDDELYVVNNGIIRELSLQNTLEIFTTRYDENYLPLTIFSYNVEYKIFGLSPFIYHLDNLLLHLLNCLLVFYLIFLLCRNNRIAFITALLFGIHPLHVESVAWVAERKDVLYSFFYLLSLILYIQYQKSGKFKYIILSLSGFILSCFSKAMAITFPVVLLLLDYYANRKFDRKVIFEKIPFFVIAFIFGVLGFLMQETHGAIKIDKLANISVNILNAVYNLGFYLYKLLLPVSLSNLYSYPASWFGMLPFIALLILAVVVVVYLKNRTINFISGFFLVAISPVLHLIPLGVGVPADRYTYIAAIGLFFLSSIGLEKLYVKFENNNSKKNMITSGITAVFLVYFILTFMRCFAWHDSQTIWSDAIKKDNNSKIAIYNLTAVAYEKGEYEKALAGYTRVIELDPLYYGYEQRANVYIRLGEFEKARADIAEMKKNKLADEATYLRLYEICDRMENKEKKGVNRKEVQAVEDGRTFLAQGNYKGAIEKYTEALAITPGKPEYLNNRGVIFSAINDNANALKDLNAAIKAMNNDALAEYYFNRGNIFRKLGENNEAIADYSRAIQKEKNKSEYYNNRGISYYSLKDSKRALADFEQAVLLNPGNKGAIKNRDKLKKIK